MNNLPFVSYTMSEPQVQLVLKIHEELRKNYAVAFDLDFPFDMKPFASFETNEIFDSGPFLKITNPRRIFHLGFIQLGYQIPAARQARSYFREFQQWGILNLSKDYGHILIKPETMLDKVHELIHHIELDFDDDPEFSKKYYILTDDKTKADLYLTPSFRDQIKAITAPDFIVEILGNQLIIGNKKLIDLESALTFVEFLDKLMLT